MAGPRRLPTPGGHHGRWLSAALAFALAACSPAFDWREVRPAGQGYAIALPDRPQSQTRALVLGAERVEMTMTSTGVGGTLFAVGVAQLPAGACSAPAHCEPILQVVRTGLARNLAGRITAAGPVRLATAPGQRLQAAEALEVTGVLARGGGTRPARLAARLYVVDDRLYQVVALGTPELLRDELLETFFLSFRLVA